MGEMGEMGEGFEFFLNYADGLLAISVCPFNPPLSYHSATSDIN